jgi:hypothetical protein
MFGQRPTVMEVLMMMKGFLAVGLAAGIAMTIFWTAILALQLSRLFLWLIFV